MKSILNPQELLQFQNKENLVLIDARTGADVREKYEAEHLAGALLVDLEVELADKKPNAAEGGRHPLPNISSFAELLGQLGIKPESHVVVYDDKSGANAAARFWWMLRAMGHTQVQVLDGEYQAALVAGFPTMSGAEVPVPALPYPQTGWQLPTVDIEEIERIRQDADFMVIDVREADRYRGEREPIDLIAGHIPGAVNIPFASNLDLKGFFLTPEELKAKYTAALENRKPENVAVHCGSGVTACHTLLAMDYAGLEIPKLYVGSWSEWSRNERPMATKE
ncbi:sulfurtransferase [Adhaeribacter rhizoryzae]|uniref:Sulfurtransferase n=1 Tax=Adhaeribacter rhizoryzae TaxID=2607907 RepID=A0A5M6D037_9BACT|nr:sulfurtransferase [Adhaeribacter rhizoryzae]KAA5540837.1 sulfurtransferase [Adhaeribacter rhizoryzae]